MLNFFNFPYLKNNLETKAFLFFSVFFFIAFQNLAFFSPWTETEIYPVHSSRYLWTENMIYFLFSLKPLFYLFLYLSSLISDLFSLLPMTGARFLFAFNGLLLLLFMYLYIKKKTNRYNAILAVLLLVSANIFLDRGFRIRSDLLSSSFSLVAGLLVLNMKSQKDYWKVYTAIPLLFSVLLISPKGIYWVLFTLCLMIQDFKHKLPLRWISSSLLATAVAFSSLSFIYKDPFFIKSIYQSAKFYFSNLSSVLHLILQKNGLMYLSDISHISLFVERNLLICLVVFVKLFFIIYSTVIKKQRKWDLSDLYFFLLLVVLIFHPQQKLFFLCSIMPFICISFFTDWKWKQLLNHSYSLKFKVLLLLSVFIYSFSYISWFNYKIYKTKNNKQQKELISQLNTFYKDTDPLISIFDPNCFIFKRTTNCKYIFDDVSSDSLNFYLKNYNFDVILGIRHIPLWNLTQYKEPLTTPKPKNFFQYINVKNYIYYKALVWDLKPKTNFLKIKQPNQNKFLSGKKLMSFLSSYLKTKTPEESRKYSYFFLNHQDRIINAELSKLEHCFQKESNTLILQPGCFYSREEFLNGLILIKKLQEKLALFYLPWQVDLEEELSLRALFRYDLWF